MPIPRKKSPPPEIPLTSTADVAFLLLIFFLVAASNAVDKGVPLDLPSTSKQATKSQSRNVEIGVSPVGMTLGGEAVKNEIDLRPLLAAKLKDVHDPSLRVVLITAEPQVSYQRWTHVIAEVEAAGGIPAPQMEEPDRKGESAAPVAAPAAAPAGEGKAP